VFQHLGTVRRINSQLSLVLPLKPDRRWFCPLAAMHGACRLVTNMSDDVVNDFAWLAVAQAATLVLKKHFTSPVCSGKRVPLNRGYGHDRLRPKCLQLLP